MANSQWVTPTNMDPIFRFALLFDRTRTSAEVKFEDEDEQEDGLRGLTPDSCYSSSIMES